MRFAMATQEKIKSAMADDAHVSLAMAAEENVTGRHGDLTDLRQRHGRRKLVEFATAFAPAPAAHFVPDTSFEKNSATPAGRLVMSALKSSCSARPPPL